MYQILNIYTQTNVFQIQQYEKFGSPLNNVLSCLFLKKFLESARFQYMLTKTLYLR